MIARITRNNLQYHFVFYALCKKLMFLLESNLVFGTDWYHQHCCKNCQVLNYQSKKWPNEELVDFL